MLPKKNRTDKKTVESIFKQGKFLNSPYFTFKFVISPGKQRKISFIVPKGVSKLATKRNLLRRKGYIALQGSLGSLPEGIAGVLVFKKYEEDVEILGKDIQSIFGKIH